ncbi:hypothetical protein FJ930_18355 [Mesorhizobium sp. B2-4-15]|uniref:hypothetical protein n=1 Tax=Mesorhizobium sp. B2-4-15 TaxID=2589934 RepID=UPI0011549A83|nr:hypothetical protein [Mesorhizobium sp. B2-4-15]TPK70288.1 hypothetical protein FJ930_18355 [Mesorhizobium sp. B2-4-15]
MPNTSVRAAAEGLPTLNRRRLLLGLAAASTAAAAVTVAPHAHSAAIQENPELVRLGNAFPAIAEEYRVAKNARSKIVKKWSKLWPSAPDEILTGRSHGRVTERDITGHGIYRNDKLVGIDSCDDLDWYIDQAERILKGKSIDKRKIHGRDREGWEAHLDELVAEYTVAAKYEAEQARILKASGYKAADERKSMATKALVAAIDAIMALPETTMAGVMIKAQALQAWGHADRWERLLTPEAAAWAPSLAATVLRLAGEAQS